MSSLGYYHPIVVHFAVALLPLGVLLRCVWLLLRKRAAFAAPAATLLLLLGAVAAAISVKTGRDAHAPVEHMPGDPPLGDHQQWGTWARNIFLAVGAVEIVALYLARRDKEKPALAAAAISAALGLGGVACVYKAGKTGGVIVYSYAGGVGVRTDDPRDVQRLLLAGIFYQARNDRGAGRKADAADLMELAGRQFPGDPEIRLLAAESLLLDRGDAPAALTALRSLDEPESARGLRFRRRMLTAQALAATGQRDEALTMLERMKDDYPPAAATLQRRIDALQKPGSAGAPSGAPAPPASP